MKNFTDNVFYETALVLREKGYDEFCSWYYHDEEEYFGDDTKEMVGDLPVKNSELMNRVCAPTFADVFDWLHERGLSVEVKCRNPINTCKECWYGSVYRISTAKMLWGSDIPDSPLWSIAADRAIMEALKLI